jgi:ubiquinone/menaquinone biosynthesis C-methylase UbiE
MANYNKMYSKNKSSWGDDVASLAISSLKYIKDGSALDLGCGQGKEIFYLKNNGFTVTAVDSSYVAIRQIKNKCKIDGIQNIKSVHANVIDFPIEDNQYDLIICFNVLYILDKEDALNVLKKIQNGVKVGGIVSLAIFSIQDPFYTKEKSYRFYVKKNELKNLFDNFEILEYFEGFIDEPAHAGLLKNHKHGIATIIARRIRV